MAQYDKDAVRNKFPSTEQREYAEQVFGGSAWRQSGSLPQQPVGLEVDAAPGNATPWKNLKTGR